MSEQEEQLSKGIKMWNKSKTDIQNGVTLHIDQSFGISQELINKNTYFATDEQIIYICGKHIVIFDIIKKTKTYILKDSQDFVQSAMNVYVDKAGIISVAVAFFEYLDQSPQVKIYNNGLMEEIVLIHNHLPPGSKIIDIQFFMKNKYLLTLSELDGESSLLSVFNVKKQSFEAQMILDYYVNKIGVNPNILGQIVLVGNINLKVFSYQADNTFIEFKSMQLLDSQNEIDIIDFCWIPQTTLFLIAMKNNTVKVYDKSKFLYDLDVNIKQDDQVISKSQQEIKKIEPYYVTCIASKINGFSIGMSSKGTVQVWELVNSDSEDQKQFEKKGDFHLQEDGNVHIQQLDTSPQSSYMIVLVSLTSSRQKLQQKQTHHHIQEKQSIYERKHDSLQLYIFNLAKVDAIKTVYMNPFQRVFFQNVPTSEIKGLSVCQSKSIFATLDEHNVQIWKYGAEFKGIINHSFYDNSPNCFSIHPLGSVIAMGFKDGVKYFQILHDSLYLFHQEIYSKQCSSINYSNSGHQLASTNSSQIFIHNSFTFELILQINGHSNSVTELIWMNNDSIIMSLCQNSIVNVWFTHNGHRFLDESFSYKQTKILTCCYDFINQLFVCSCADSTVKIFSAKDKNLLYTIQLPSKHLITDMLLSHENKVIFMANNFGSIKVYLWPILDYQLLEQEYIEFAIHIGSLSKMKMTPDNSYLITVSEDSSMYLSKITVFQDGDEQFSLADMGQKLQQFLLNDISITTFSIQEETNDKLKAQEFKIDNLKSEIENEKDRIMSRYNQRIQILQEQNENVVKQLEFSLEKQIKEQEKYVADKLAKIQSNQSDFDQNIIKVNELNDDDFRYMIAINDDLDKQYYDEKNKINEEINQAKQDSEKLLQQAEQDYEQNYQNLFNKLKQALENMQNDQEKFKEIFKQSEDEQELYLKKTEQELQNFLDEENKRAVELRKSNSTLSKENIRYKERQIFLENMIKDTEDQIAHMKLETVNFELKNESMQKQLREKELIINEKEKDIKDFRSKNKHLKNFRSVYDYRVNTLNDEMGPLMTHLQGLDAHIKNMYQELLEESQANKRLKEQIGETDIEISKLKEELAQKLRSLAVSNRKVENIEYKLTDLIKNNKVETWSKSLKEIFKQNFQDNKLNQNQLKQSKEQDELQEKLEKNEQEQIQKELLRQRDFLNKKLNSLEQKNKRIEADRDIVFFKIQDDNTKLLKECNILRKEKQILTTEHSEKQHHIRSLRRQLANLNHSLGQDIMEEDEEYESNQKKQSLQKKITYKVKELPFVTYQTESLPRIRQTQSEAQLHNHKTSRTLFGSILEELDKSNSNYHKGISLESLKLKVQTFIKTNESQDDDPSIQFKNQNSTISLDEQNISINKNKFVPKGQMGIQSSIKIQHSSKKI